MIRKQLTTVALFIILMPTLIACAGVNTGTQSSLSPLCPGKEPPEKVTTIEWWEIWANPALTRAVQEFNCAHPDIQVKITLYPKVGDDSQGKLLAAIVGNRPPDLILSYNDVLASWASRGMLQPIESYTDQVGIKSSEFVPEAWQSVQWLNHTYGVPVDWDPDTLLWYNKKVFQEVGLDPNKPPTTWAEFEEYAEKIDLVENGKIKRLGFVPWAGWEFNNIQLGHMFKGNLESGSSKVVSLNTPGMRQALEWEQEIAKKFGGASTINSYTNIANSTGPASDPLFSGRIGMMMNGDWYMGNRAIFGEEEFRETIGVTSIPVPPDGQSYMCHSGWAFMIPRGAQNIEETMTFVNWMLQDDHFHRYFGEALGWIPAKLSARNVDFYQKDPLWQDIFAANEKTESEQYWLLPSPVMTEYYRALENAESQVINLKASPAEALAEADAIVQQFLQTAIIEGNYG